VLEFDLDELVEAADEDLHVANGLCPALTRGQAAAVVDGLVSDHVTECQPLRRWLWFDSGRRIDWRRVTASNPLDRLADRRRGRSARRTS
jgi:hypothetical protein